MQDVRVDVQDVQDVHVDVRDVGNLVQGVDDKLDQANVRCSLSLNPESFRALMYLDLSAAELCGRANGIPGKEGWVRWRLGCKDLDG